MIRNSNNKINVICFYWQGTDRPGWMDYHLGLKYIINLYNGFKRNTTIPFEFHCLTTHMEFAEVKQCKGIIFHKLESPSWLGCLPKYSMFNSEYKLKGRVFACDLDVVITGCMDEILSFDGKFSTRSTFNGEKESGGDLIAFDGGTYKWIWEEFKNNTDEVVDFTKGRERWVYRYHKKMKPFPFLQDLYPNQICSYKNHISHGRSLPKGARLVTCHGKPRPHEIKESWVKECWES